MKVKEAITVECTWTSRTFNPKNLKVFRKRYPIGKNYVVANDIVDTFDRVYDEITVYFVSLEGLMKELA